MRIVAPLRSVGQRFALALFIIASVLLIILGKADTLLFERLRTGFADATAPVLAFFARPAGAVDAAIDHVHDMVALYRENTRLREENSRLLQWQQAAQNLRSENARLKSLLNLVPEASASFVTGKVIANSGGTYYRSRLVNAGRADGVVRGQAAITGEGLAGRVTEVGERTSYILLITDLNSRIPVIIDRTRERAILAGDNSDQPSLLYLGQKPDVQVGDRLVTSGDGGIFPPGLPVGVVASIEDAMVHVEPFVELSRLDYLRIVDYGLSGMLPQPVVPIVRSSKGKGAASVPMPPAEETPR
jgi:rod shape-determining protein MreC